MACPTGIPSAELLSASLSVQLHPALQQQDVHVESKNAAKNSAVLLQCRSCSVQHLSVLDCVLSCVKICIMFFCPQSIYHIICTLVKGSQATVKQLCVGWQHVKIVLMLTTLLQSGAKHVYGVECSAIADQAKRIVADNGYSDRVTIIKGKVSSLTSQNHCLL